MFGSRTRIALESAMTRSLFLVLTIVIAIFTTLVVTKAYALPNPLLQRDDGQTMKERVKLTQALLDQETPLATETTRILQGLIPSDNATNQAEIVAWVMSKNDILDRLFEISNERGRNLVSVYCSDFDVSNSHALAVLDELRVGIRIAQHAIKKGVDNKKIAELVQTFKELEMVNKDLHLVMLRTYDDIIYGNPACQVNSYAKPLP